MSPLLELHAQGQRVWLDNLSRTLLCEGVLKRMVDEDGVAGVTSNPTIFFKAISESAYYREDLARLKSDPKLSTEERYERLAIPDIEAACDLLRSLYEKTSGEDGYVSLEVSPALAYDAGKTVAAAQRLRAAVGRDNLLIKVPGTPAGVIAVEELIGKGLSINVTLMFSLEHVREVAQAYIRGLARWTEGGGEARKVKSVASLFLSRVDTLVDRKLDAIGDEALALRGKSGVALAKLAYQEYKSIFKGAEFARLAERSARPQYMLWASTGAKNPAYSDVLYVEPLIGPETINTLPDATLAAFRGHGRATLTLERDVDAARQQFEALTRRGIDMGQVGEILQAEGVKLFAQSFEQLLGLMAEPVKETA
ncbi:MAG: transaldolase [Betaproteobacteria bacterium RIFCSPLOWO2_12_FULL_62_13]|nr:MAG: transaldolase [Betaproteobacteria bacterium RIFCSPLOWO2_12_FULL_62_13]